MNTWADPEGAKGGRDPPKITEMCFFSNPSPDPLKNHKATCTQLAIIGTPAKPHLNGVSLAAMMVRLYW